MTTIINASNGSTSGLITTADASGVLQLQTNNGTPALTLNTTQALGVGSSPSYGTTGQFLTSQGSAASPTWTTPSSGAMTLISTLTANNTSQYLTFTGLNSYDKYMIIYQNLVLASASFVYINIGTGAGPTYLTSGIYSTNLFAVSNSSTAGASGTANYSQILPSSNQVGTGALGFNGYLIFAGANGGYLSFNGNISHINSTNTQVYGYMANGGVTSANSISAIQFYSASGNIVSGKASLYGISS